MVTVQDLRNGFVARLSSAEYGKLARKSPATLSRWRWLGFGIPFTRDSNGRVFYDAADVLSYLDGQPKFKSTSEYEHSGNVRMEKARAAVGK